MKRLIKKILLDQIIKLLRRNSRSKTKIF